MAKWLALWLLTASRVGSSGMSSPCVLSILQQLSTCYISVSNKGLHIYRAHVLEHILTWLSSDFYVSHGRLLDKKQQCSFKTKRQGQDKQRLEYVLCLLIQNLYIYTLWKSMLIQLLSSFTIMLIYGKTGYLLPK